MLDDEKQLVYALREGDVASFTKLYHAYKERLTVRLLYLLKSEILVEEVLQNLFLKIWESREQVNPDKSFKSYLYTIAKHMVIDIFRRAAKERTVMAQLKIGQEELYHHVEDFIFRKENKALLTELMSILPTKRRSVFIACKLDGKSYKEVAELHNISINTVNDHIQKAGIVLKEYLINSKEGLTLLILCSLLN